MEADLYYWYDQNKHEVDIVLELFRKPVPIEIKYQNDISRGELEGVSSFLSKFKPSFGLVVTKDTLLIDGKMLFIPLWLFLFLCKKC